MADPKPTYEELVEALFEYALLGSGRCTISKEHAEKTRALLTRIRQGGDRGE